MTIRLSTAAIFAAAASALITAAPAAAQIKIGIGAPLTGPIAAFGAQIKSGVEQAAEDINAAGGMNGQKIELFYGDDVAEPRQGVSVANRFAGDGVQFVVGHFNSGVTMPASETYADNSILMITPGSTNPEITERKFWNVFRTCGRDDQQGAVAGAYIAKTFKDKKVAIVHDKTTYGKGLADETRKAMAANGIKDVLYEGVNQGEKDYTALVSKIKEKGADLVYWGGTHTEGGLILRQMRDQALKSVMMGGDGIVTEEFAAIAGPGTEGTLMTFGPDPQKRPEAAAVLEKFKAKKFKPESYTLYSYAALQVIANAANAAKSNDPKKVAAEIASGKPIKTVLGDLSYDAKGDVKRNDYVVYTWKKGADGHLMYEQNP